MKFSSCLLLLALLLFSHVSCTVDPLVKTLEPYVERNPRPDAIVGMWHADKGGGFSESLLFKRNGDCVSRLITADYFGNRNAPQTQTYFWTYKGNGEWAVTIPAAWAGTTDEKYKIAKGRLIAYGTGGLGNPIRTVYSRVD